MSRPSVRNLSAKNIQARLGLVEYERSDRKLNTMISMDLSSQRDTESFISALKTIQNLRLL